MQTTARFSTERAELEAVLNSGIFTRSPSLAQFLQYVCQRYFDGEADKIKEYNVAVDALGRPPDFDQKKDSIVRVEAHRLRKRLQQYYSQEGADHPIQIALPPGNYVPQFLPKCAEVAIAETPGENGIAVGQQSEPTTVVDLVLPIEAQPLTPVVVVHRPRWRRLLFMAAVVAIAVLVTFWMVKTRKDSAVTATSSLRILPPPEGEEIRILAGSTATKLLDHYGNSWGGDRYYDGGVVASSPARPIARSQDFSMYTTRREGKFSYHIPLKKGTYEMRLYFAEVVFGDNNMFGGGETTRVFNIDMNGKQLLSGFDVIGDAPGSNTADIRVFKDVVPAADGKLHLDFYPTDRAAFVNAIELLPAHKGYLRPIRLIASDGSFTDRANRVWSSDRYFQGGVLIRRHDPIRETEDDLLYQSERYGNFTYSIPVAPNSHYTLTLRFCENWWGAPHMSAGGIGDRVFDVYSNGRTLLRNFDVFKEAGGPLRPIDKIFRNLEPNAQGKLVFQFVPVRNYAVLNGLEVLDEGR